MQVGVLDGSAGNEFTCSTGDRGDSVQSRGQEDSWRREMAVHSSILDWFPAGLVDAKELSAPGFNPWVVKIPLEKGMATYPIFKTEAFHGRRNLGRPQSTGHKEF